MKREVLLSPRAEADVDAHAGFIAENIGVERALHFDDMVFESLERLREMPFIGSERTYSNPLLAGLRLWFVKDFEKYLIFYRVIDDAVQIVRILHSSQDTENIISGDIDGDETDDDETNDGAVN